LAPIVWGVLARIGFFRITILAARLVGLCCPRISSIQTTASFRFVFIPPWPFIITALQWTAIPVLIFERAIITTACACSFIRSIVFVLPELAALRRRQGGYGRGGRQKIETDTVQVMSGVRQGKTIGSPILLQVVNKDSRLDDAPAVHRPRPGHADLAG